MSWEALALWALILGTMLLGAGITVIALLVRGIRHAHDHIDLAWLDEWEPGDD